MTDQEIIYKAIREVVNTDNPVKFAAHNSTCYTIAKYVCEELRKELNTFPAEQPISDYLQAREKISSYLYNLIFDQAHRGAPMLQYGDTRINEEVDLILKMAIRELNKKVLTEQPSEDLEEAANLYANKQGLELKPFARRFFKAGAQWQKEQITKLLKTIYSDCDNLKKDLDRVTTGNLPHRIGNIKFSITGIQVIIKQVMEDEQ